MLIIKEYGGGPGGAYIGSKPFVETAQGYAQARAEIDRITNSGNVCKNDDSGKVLNYTGG